jgi:hypothetical protein
MNFSYISRVLQSFIHLMFLDLITAIMVEIKNDEISQIVIFFILILILSPRSKIPSAPSSQILPI